MKKFNCFIKVYYSLILLFVVISCTTTKAIAKPTKKNIIINNGMVKTEVVSNSTFVSYNSSSKIQEGSDIKLKVESYPKQTTKNKAFPSAYIVSVKDIDGNPLEDFSITASYPISRTNDSIIYETIAIKTDNEGKISFLPNVPKFSFDDIISFYPTTDSSNEQILKELNNVSVSAPFVVKTDLTNKSAIVYVFDFDEKERATTNSRYILRDIINSGIKAGNSPFSSASYLNKSIEELYKDTKNIVGNSYGFMVVGSVKYVEPISKDENGKYSCSLVANITCIDMQNGNILYETKQYATDTSTTQANAIDSCKQKLASKTVRAILYSM